MTHMSTAKQEHVFTIVTVLEYAILSLNALLLAYARYIMMNFIYLKSLFNVSLVKF